MPLSLTLADIQRWQRQLCDLDPAFAQECDATKRKLKIQLAGIVKIHVDRLSAKDYIGDTVSSLSAVHDKLPNTTSNKASPLYAVDGALPNTVSNHPKRLERNEGLSARATSGQVDNDSSPMGNTSNRRGRSRALSPGAASGQSTTVAFGQAENSSPSMDNTPKQRGRARKEARVGACVQPRVLVTSIDEIRGTEEEMEPPPKEKKKRVSKIGVLPVIAVGPSDQDGNHTIAHETSTSKVKEQEPSPKKTKKRVSEIELLQTSAVGRSDQDSNHTTALETSASKSKEQVLQPTKKKKRRSNIELLLTSAVGPSDQNSNHTAAHEFSLPAIAVKPSVQDCNHTIAHELSKTEELKPPPKEKKKRVRQRSKIGELPASEVGPSDQDCNHTIAHEPSTLHCTHLNGSSFFNATEKHTSPTHSDSGNSISSSHGKQQQWLSQITIQGAEFTDAAVLQDVHKSQAPVQPVTAYKVPAASTAKSPAIEAILQDWLSTSSQERPETPNEGAASFVNTLTQDASQLLGCSEVTAPNTTSLDTLKPIDSSTPKQAQVRPSQGLRNNTSTMLSTGSSCSRAGTKGAKKHSSYKVAQKSSPAENNALLQANAVQNQSLLDQEEDENLSAHPPGVIEDGKPSYNAELLDWNEVLNGDCPETIAMENTKPRHTTLSTNQASRSLETPVPLFTSQEIPVPAPITEPLHTPVESLKHQERPVKLSIHQPGMQGQNSFDANSPVDMDIDRDDVLSLAASQTIDSDDDYVPIENGTSLDMIDGNTQAPTSNEGSMAAGSESTKRFQIPKISKHLELNQQNINNVELPSTTQVAQQPQYENWLLPPSNYARNTFRGRGKAGNHSRGRNFRRNNRRYSRKEYSHSEVQPQRNSAHGAQWRHNNHRFPRYSGYAGQMRNMASNQPWQDRRHHISSSTFPDGCGPSQSNIGMQSAGGPLQPHGGNAQSQNTNGSLVCPQPNMGSGQGGYFFDVSTARNQQNGARSYNSIQSMGGNAPPHFSRHGHTRFKPPFADGCFERDDRKFQNQAGGNAPSEHTSIPSLLSLPTARPPFLQPNLGSEQNRYVPNISRTIIQAKFSNVQRSSQLVGRNPPPQINSGPLTFSQSNITSSLLQNNIGNFPNVSGTPNQACSSNIQTSLQLQNANFSSQLTNRPPIFSQSTTSSSLLQQNMGSGQNNNNRFVPNISATPNQAFSANVQTSSQLNNANYSSQDTNGPPLFSRSTTASSLLQQNMGTSQNGYVHNVSRTLNQPCSNNVQTSSQLSNANFPSQHTNGPPIFAQSTTGSSLLQQIMGSAHNGHVPNVSRTPNHPSSSNVPTSSQLNNAIFSSQHTNGPPAFSQSTTDTSALQLDLAGTQNRYLADVSRPYDGRVQNSSQLTGANPLIDLGISGPYVGRGPTRFYPPFPDAPQPQVNAGQYPLQVTSGQDGINNLVETSQSVGGMGLSHRFSGMSPSQSTGGLRFSQPNDGYATSDQQTSRYLALQRHIKQEPSAEAYDRLRQREEQRAERLRIRTRPVSFDPFEGLAPIRVADNDAEEEDLRAGHGASSSNVGSLQPPNNSSAANLRTASHGHAVILSVQTLPSQINAHDEPEVEVSEPQYSAAANVTPDPQYNYNCPTHPRERQYSVVLSSMPEPPFAKKTRQIAELFGITCFRFLCQQCAKGSYCKYSHIYADASVVSAALEQLAEDELTPALRFMFNHQRLFQRYFNIFCDIYALRKNSRMLLSLFQRCEYYDNGVRFVDILYRGLSRCYASKTKACEEILKCSRNRSMAFIGALVKIIVDASWPKFCSFLDECVRLHGFKFDLETCKAMVPPLQIYYDEDILRVFCKCVATMRRVDRTSLMGCVETQWIWPLCVTMVN